jgi:hypothetical protein
VISSDTSADDGGSEDGRRSSDDGSRSGHKDLGSTAQVDILQWADHFEPWLSWLRPAIRPPPDRSVLILSCSLQADLPRRNNNPLA